MVKAPATMVKTLRPQAFRALAAAAALALAVAGVTRAHGYRSTAVQLGVPAAWLGSDSPTSATLLDGATATVEAQVKLPFPRGAQVSSSQNDAAAYFLDSTTGRLVRVDSATDSLSASARPIPGAGRATLAVFAAQARVYLVDERRGLVADLDPKTLRPLHVTAAVAPGVGSAVLDPAGALWLLGTDGTITVDDGGHRRHARATNQGDRSELTLAAGRVALVDYTTRRASLLSSSITASKSVCVDVPAGDTTAAAGGSADHLWVSEGAGGMLVGSDAVTSSCSASVPIADPGSELGPPVIAAGRAYVADYTDGRVVVVDTPTARVLADLQVVRPGPFELRQVDGIVFFNDPTGADAGVIRLDGTTARVEKYPSAGRAGPRSGVLPGQVVAAGPSPKAGALSLARTGTGASVTPLELTAAGAIPARPARSSGTLPLIAAAPLAVSTTVLAAAIAGSPYRFTLGATGGVLPYRWSAGGLPAGLSVAEGTGVISGVAVSAGQAIATVTVTVTDAAGDAASRPGLVLGVLPPPSTPPVVEGTSPPPPVVTSLSLREGLALGGETLDIAGANLAGATAVRFGSTGASFRIVSAEQITVTTPAATTGTVDVTVTTPAGTSEATPPDQYVFLGRPQSTSWMPAVNGMMADAVLGDAEGDVFFSDDNRERVYVIPAGASTPVPYAGNGARGSSGDGGPATAAKLNSPSGMAISATGDVYIADQFNGRVRRIDRSTGIITTVVGVGSGTGPDVKGMGGPAGAAFIGNPVGLVFATDGDLFVTSRNYEVVLRVAATSGAISSASTVSIYAGTNGVPTCLGLDQGCGPLGDQGPATASHLYFPNGLALDSAGDLYVGDDWDNRVRKVTPPGSGQVITTVAGGGTTGPSATPTAASASALSNPSSIAMDQSGDLYIGEYNGLRIDVVTPTGELVAVAGADPGPQDGNPPKRRGLVPSTA